MLLAGILKLPEAIERNKVNLEFEIATGEAFSIAGAAEGHPLFHILAAADQVFVALCKDRRKTLVDDSQNLCKDPRRTLFGGSKDLLRSKAGAYENELARAL